MKACDYVYFNLEGKPGSRAELRAWERGKLRSGGFLHYVDPCLLRDGHEGSHRLSTMFQPSEVQPSSALASAQQIDAVKETD